MPVQATQLSPLASKSQSESKPQRRVNSSKTSSPERWSGGRSLGFFAIALVVVVVLWRIAVALGVPDPLAMDKNAGSAVLDIGVLVFREGLEWVMVLAALTASMVGPQSGQKKPVMWGSVAGAVATLITWFIAVRILDDLSGSVSALNLQAATGLLAIVVLLVVMNWFFHKMYWTGWISMHNKKKHALTKPEAEEKGAAMRRNVFLGLALLGFSTFYREGFEVVLFLQSYRLKLGTAMVMQGTLIGIALTLVVAVLTFVLHRKLPYRKMLVLTGVMLGAVLMVMVGEQVQEMQAAGWISTHAIDWLEPYVPGWFSLWTSFNPNWESVIGQGIAFVLVVGSYFVAEKQKAPKASGGQQAELAA